MTNKIRVHIAKPHRQKGAALVVALVVLAAVTVIGVSNMRSTNLQLGMTAAKIDRDKSFAIVEGALQMATDIIAPGSADFAVSIDRLHDDCTGSGCWNDSCAGGYCADVYFPSSYIVGGGMPGCIVAPDAGTDPRVDYWRRSSIWSDGDRHRVIDIDGIEVKVIYEFMCFVDVTTNPPPYTSAEWVNGDAQFRITAYLDDEGSGQDSTSWRPRGRLMLQTMWVISGDDILP